MDPRLRRQPNPTRPVRDVLGQTCEESRAEMMRRADSTIRRVHLVEVIRSDGPIGPMHGVVTRLHVGSTRFRGVMQLMDLRGHDAAQPEGQKRKYRGVCSQGVRHGEIGSAA